MRLVYQEGGAVLVTVEDLQQIPLHYTSRKWFVAHRTVLMFRFSLSGWNSKLWIFEERRLAKKVYLLLEYGIIRAIYCRAAIDLHILRAIMSETVSYLREIILGNGPQETRVHPRPYNS